MADSEADKKPEEAKQATPAGAGDSAPPSDALAKPSSETDQADPISSDPKSGADKPAKQPSAIKKLLKRFNVYFLLFLLIAIIGGIVTVVSYLNSKKAAPSPSVASQNLTTQQLKQLASSNATVGGSGQTITIQGNAVFSGQVLVRSNLDVAGTIQLGGNLDVAQVTVSNSANLANTQTNTLQVANTAIFQGLVTIQNGVNVAGASSFSGPVSVNQLTVTNLIMSGNAQLQVPNHIAFTGATPGRTINFNVLGGGGSASIFGSDTSGTVNINTGNNPVAGCFVTFVFNQVFKSTPHVLISPVGIAAGETEYYVNRSTTTFSVCTANAAPANANFAFDYFITD